MGPRMLCTDCHTTSTPDTRLEGDDRLEALGWLCLAWPGLLYCAWRHALRTKVCPLCGGGELVREARAAAPDEAAPALWGGPTVVSRGSFAWPPGWSSPRERLRRGAVAGLLVNAALLGFVAAGAGTSAGVLPAGVALAALGCAVAELRRVRRARARRDACGAWDAQGRPLRVELRV